jgi:hypothetical protein
MARTLVSSRLCNLPPDERASAWRSRDLGIVLENCEDFGLFNFSKNPEILEVKVVGWRETALLDCEADLSVFIVPSSP